MITKEDILEEFNEEIPTTRKMLECVPLDKSDFKPSPKEMPLGQLAFMVSSMPGWFIGIVKDNHIDLATYPMPPHPTNVEELLAVFDEGVEGARKALAMMDDNTLTDKWELRMKDKVLMESTRGATLRQTINHIVHHRAQLGVYHQDERDPASCGVRRLRRRRLAITEVVRFSPDGTAYYIAHKVELIHY